MTINNNDGELKEPITIDDVWDKQAGRFKTKGVLEIAETTGKVEHFYGYSRICCIAHGDMSPSMAVYPDDDNPDFCYLNCFVGCSFGEILNAYKVFCGDADGDGIPDFSPRPVPTPDETEGNTQKQVYNYTDADGKTLFRKYKWWEESQQKNSYSIKTLKHNGQWANKLTVEPVLYQLPRVMQAIERKVPVIIVEGEKDVHTIMRYFPDTVATTNFDGASADKSEKKGKQESKWKSSYTNLLKQAVRVYMIADNDEAGQRHMENVAKSLKEVGSDLYIVKLPDIDKVGIGADVSDWMECGDIKSRRAELKQAVKQAKPYKPELSDFGIITGNHLSSMAIKEHSWIVEQLIPVGLTNLFAGERVGKSVLAMQVAYAVASGKPLFGKFRTEQGRVLYLALEQSRQTNRNRIEMLADCDKIPDTLNIVSAEDGWKPTDKGGLADLEQYLTFYPDTKLIIIDVWQTIAPSSSGGLNAYEKDSKHLKPLHQIANRKGVAIVFLHHTNKTYGVTDPFDKSSGSRGMLSVPDHLIAMTRPPEDENGKVMTKSRVGQAISWGLRLESAEGKLYWEYLGNAYETAKTQQRQDIVDILKSSAEPLSVADLVDILKDEKSVIKSKGSLKKLLARMAKDGEVVKDGKGIYSASRLTLSSDELRMAEKQRDINLDVDVDLDSKSAVNKMDDINKLFAV